MDSKLNYLIFIFIICSVVININKPLQMDELSTFFHCSSKTYHKLVDANISGVNMIPPAYFYLLWGIDNLFNLNKYLLRFVPLLFGIFSIIITYKLLRLYFEDKTATLTIFTVLSHCPIFLFSICESRPYSMYLFLVLLFIYISSVKENKAILFLCTLINFLIPSTFYFGGIYCISIFTIVSLYRILNKKPIMSYVFSCSLGWLLFLSLTFPTFLHQIDSTFTTHFNSDQYVHTSALFSLQGMQVYFPISLVLLILISSKRSPTNPPGQYFSLISLSLVIVPIFIFLICKLLKFQMFQERYFIPTILFYIIFYCFVIHGYKVLSLKKTLINFHLGYCTLILIYLTSSYAKAYSSDDFSDTLETIKENESPIFTFSRRVAFQLSYEGYPSYLLVRDKEYSEHMISFSNHLHPIPIDIFYSTINEKLIDFDEVFYVSTPWVNEDINQIKSEFFRHGITFENIDINKSKQINSIYSLTKI